jgi:3-oxoacyl-[acyl-carrier protein] reductase
VADLLLDISRRPLAKRLVRQLKLPIQLPEHLARSTAPWQNQPLAQLTVAVVGKGSSPLTEGVHMALKSEGAQFPNSRNDAALLGAIVCDATALTRSDDLGMLFETIKPRLKSLRPCGRILILGKAGTEFPSPEEAAISAALRGFVKSLAKEVGKRGITCNLLTVPSQHVHCSRLAWPMVFFLSPCSAYISGQVVHIDAFHTGDSDEISRSLSQADGSDLLTTGGNWAQALSGKVALVTGAAGGIGAAICRRLASEGAKVIGLDRPTDKHTLDALMKEIGGIAMAHDLGATGSIQHIVSRIETEIGSLDILVHNAGITRDKTLARMPRDYWDDVLNINLKAPMELTSALVLSDSGLIRLMGPGGRIIFISSIGGIAGNMGQTNYAASKAGLIGYTEALARKVAGRDITVNAIAPGFIETTMTSKMPMAIREVARRLNALGQGGQPDDVANSVFFLAAPAAHSISGSVLRVCGLSMLGA